MARQPLAPWWPTSRTWLQLLLVSMAICPVWAASGSGGDANLETDNVAGEFVHRLTVPLMSALSEPNVMARDAFEQAQQLLLLHAGERECRRGVLEALAVVSASPPAPGAGLEARRQPAQTAPPEAPTPLARLIHRQDNSGQIAALSAQIQSLSLVASSISQASRSVSQTSQQLAQQVTQLSQSTGRLSQSINSLQNSVQQVQQSVQQAQQAQRSAEDAARQASQLVSSAMSSAAASASSAIASNLASATSSASSVIAAASASALNIANAAASQVKSAQADATVARADAASQVQKAQGTAVSVTQAALAIVGTFFGSSLLTIAAFYFILRYKSNKRRRTRLLATRGIGDPKPQGYGDQDGQRVGGYGTNGYPIDLKTPPLRRSPSGSNSSGNIRGGREKRPDVGELSLGSGFAFAAFDVGNASTASTRAAPGRRPSIGGQSLSQFPAAADITKNKSSNNERPPASPSIYATQTSIMTSVTLAGAKTTTNNPTRPPPSLQQWLQEGTVSPFGTLRRDSGSEAAAGYGGGGGGSRAAPDTSSAAGPFSRQQQQLRATVKRSMGVGGVNAGGGGSGRTIQPGGTLPLRDN